MISDGLPAVNPFSPELLSQIDQAIAEIKKRFPPPHIAAFDADGTLWQTDVGELLFQYQIINGVLPVSAEEITAKYRRYLAEKSHETLYAWQAELNGGQKEQTVQRWIKESQTDVIEPAILTDQQRLIGRLQQDGFQVYVVTASFAPTVVPPARKYFNIPGDQVLGVSLSVENGVYAARTRQTVTCGAGKAERLLEATGGIHPVFCCGNTVGDLELLQCSTHFRLAVRSVPEDHVNYNSEDRLYRWARRMNWAHHRF